MNILHGHFTHFSDCSIMCVCVFEIIHFHEGNGSTPIRRQDATWWRHQIETFFALLALCAGNSPVSGEFLSQRSVTRSIDVFFDLCLNKRLSKQSGGWWFETPHYDVIVMIWSNHVFLPNACLVPFRLHRASLTHPASELFNIVYIAKMSRCLFFPLVVSTM